MLLKDKVILVVGAGGLLGREIVKSVISEGGRVIAGDIRLEHVEPFLNVFGKDFVLPIQIDITNKESIKEALSSGDEGWNTVVGAVNTAYPKNNNYGQMALEVTYEDFCENLNSHLGGYFLFMQQCALFSKMSNLSFSLVNLSSIYGAMAPKFEVYDDTVMTMPVEYAAIKSSLLHLNKYFSKFMKGTGFRVNSVSPGGIRNCQPHNFIEKYKSYSRLKGMLDPSDIVGAITFLLSEKSEFICGQNITVDDAFSL